MEPILDRTLRTFAGYNVKRTYLLIHERALQVLEPHQLRPTSFSALVIIADNPDLTQSQLANALEIKRSGVVLIVDELEERDLITRNKVPDDRRSYALRPTLKGLRLRDKIVGELKKAEDSLLAALSSEEKQLLTGLYTKLKTGTGSTNQSVKPGNRKALRKEA